MYFLVLLAPPAITTAFGPNPQSVREFVEPAALAAAAKVRSTTLSLPPSLANGPVESSYISTGVARATGVPPVVILHSFDSSCLEWRRVVPLLEESSTEAYALDILGWGFTDFYREGTTFVRSSNRPS